MQHSQQHMRGGDAAQNQNFPRRGSTIGPYKSRDKKCVEIYYSHIYIYMKRVLWFRFTVNSRYDYTVVAIYLFELGTHF
jgi:hypothetical protein